MKRTRLLNLAAHLENDFKGKGRMVDGYLRIKSTTNPKFTFDLSDWQDKTQCGTVGCAVGYLPAIDPQVTVKEELGSLYFKFEGNKYWGIDLAEVYFDITDEEAEAIFIPIAYATNPTGFVDVDDDDPATHRVTPQMVAARIRELVRNRAKFNNKYIWNP